MRNLLLTIFEYLVVTRMFIFVKMRGRNWTLSLRNVFFWGMDLQAKAYRLYDFTKKKVFLSRDVIFNEQKFGHDDIGQETESHKYVYFDCFDDISDSDSHTVEECSANTTEESPANAEDEVSANNDASSAMCTP